MNRKVHSLLQELEYALPAMNPVEALIHSRDMNRQLNGYIRHHIFENRQYEILFFKVFKPRFLAHILENELLRVPPEERSPYLEGVDMDFRLYYESSRTDLDPDYYQEKKCDKMAVDCNGTGYETWVAKIMVKHWLGARRPPNKKF